MKTKFYRRDSSIYSLDNKCRLHREDGPALIYRNGSLAWYANGKLHRDGDKPAVEFADGSKEWWVNGERVR